MVNDDSDRRSLFSARIAGVFGFVKITAPDPESDNSEAPYSFFAYTLAKT